MMAMSDTMSKSSPDIQILTGDVQTEVSKHQGAIRQRHAGRGIIQSVHVLPCKSQDNLVKGVADDVRFRSLCPNAQKYISNYSNSDISQHNDIKDISNTISSRR